VCGQARDNSFKGDRVRAILALSHEHRIRMKWGRALPSVSTDASDPFATLGTQYSPSTFEGPIYQSVLGGWEPFEYSRKRFHRPNVEACVFPAGSSLQVYLIGSVEERLRFIIINFPPNRVATLGMDLLSQARYLKALRDGTVFVSLPKTHTVTSTSHLNRRSPRNPLLPCRAHKPTPQASNP